MAPTTFTQLAQTADLFDRAHLMPRPSRRYPGGGPFGITLEQVSVAASVHPELPPTPAWTYEGLLPGPVLIVPSDGAIRVRHRNRVIGTLPYRHVTVDSSLGSMNDPGTTGEVTTGHAAAITAATMNLSAHTVTHLHGGPSSADSDGWAENVCDFGEEDSDIWEFPRESWPGINCPPFRSGAGPMFWYHDHGMGVTRFNVYAGLAGTVIVRDPVEDSIGLPTGRQREIPLVIADRNLETDDDTAGGVLTGRMLHKVETEVMECFAPVNLVNGLAWPRCEVRPRVHRLRLLNGSNARTYRLHFLGLTSPTDPAPTPIPSEFIQQIGTDGGLLGVAVDLPADGLILAPAERADLLVDFGALAASGITHVEVHNNAPAPFGGQPPRATGEDDVTGSDPDGFRAISHVMRFDLTAGPPVTGLRGHPIAGLALDPEYRRVDHALIPGHGHSVIALREEEEVLFDHMGAPMGTHTGLFLHELLHEDMAEHLGLNLRATTVPTWDGVTLGSRPSGVRITLPGDPMPWVTIGKRFRDASMITIPRGGWHLWKIINISPDTHPFHVHLTQFQALSRVLLGVDPVANPTGVDPGADEFVLTTSTVAPLDANETGWKDTVRVNPGERGPADEIVSAEMVTVGGCFAHHSGKYMYHCHILEHEDTEMMRSFTVLPGELMDVMAMSGH